MRADTAALVVDGALVEALRQGWEKVTVQEVVVNDTDEIPRVHDLRRKVCRGLQRREKG